MNAYKLASGSEACEGEGERGREGGGRGGKIITPPRPPPPGGLAYC